VLFVPDDDLMEGESSVILYDNFDNVIKGGIGELVTVSGKETLEWPLTLNTISTSRVNMRLYKI
jgi:hypothetical protein